MNTTQPAPRFVVVVTRRVSYSDGSSVATRFAIADRDDANRTQGCYVSRDVAQIRVDAMNAGRGWCSNLACPLAVTFHDPDGELCPYCTRHQPGIEVAS